MIINARTFSAVSYAIDRQHASRNLYETAAHYLTEAMRPHRLPQHRAWWLAQAEFFQGAAAHEAAVARRWTERVLL